LASASASAAGAAQVSTAASASANAPQVVNALSVTMDIVRHEGIKGLYRGLSASYLGVSEGVIQWVLYEVSLKTGLHGFS
jgi:solute carrier family 25 protein 33/36